MLIGEQCWVIIDKRVDVPGLITEDADSRLAIFDNEDDARSFYAGEFWCSGKTKDECFEVCVCRIKRIINIHHFANDEDENRIGESNGVLDL